MYKSSTDDITCDCEFISYITVMVYELNGVSNDRQLHCFAQLRVPIDSKEISKPTSCESNPSETSGFPLQRATNAEIMFISRRHHVTQNAYDEPWHPDDSLWYNLGLLRSYVAGWLWVEGATQ